MASFTDQIPTFNPFVPTLPVEAMVQVGQYKQQKYEENVQKIQAQIDNIAGLNVSRPIDKQYLQSKLNELGNNLTSVAAGDFSNFQLVNSVSGMTSQIVKDPNIQAAILSSEHIKNEQTFMDEERKKGTLHRNNEIYYNDSLNKYYNSTKLGERFSTKYQTYTDYQKKWREIKKDLDIKEDTSDLPFVMKDGKPVIGADGKPIVNDYMVRETFKGIDPDRLKQAIMSAMDDNDFKQMQIDAYVQYKGYSPDTLADMAKDRYDENEKPLLKTLDRLNLLKNQNSGNQQMLNAINKNIASINARLANDKAEFDQSLDDLYANPEEFKRKIFTMDAINQFANSFSNISHIQQIVESPIVKKMQEDRNYNFSVIKFQTENLHWQKDYDIKAATEKRLQEDSDFSKKLELYKLGLGPNPLGPVAGKYENAPPTDPDILNGIIESFKQGADLEQLTKDQNVLKAQWAKNQPKGTNLEEGFALALTNYEKDPNSIKDPSTRQILSQYTKLNTLRNLKVNAINDATQQAEELHPEYKKMMSTLSNDKVDFVQWRPSRFPSGRVNPAGEKYVALSKSQAEIYNDIKSGEAKLYVDAGQILLTYPKQGIKYDIPRIGTSFVGSDKTKALLLDLNSKLTTLNQVEKSKNKDFARILGDKINSIIPVSSQLPVGSADKFMPLIENKFAREQKNQTEEATGFVVGKDFDINKLRSLALYEKTVPTFTTYGDDVYVTFTGKIKDVAAVQNFKVSKSEFNKAFPGVITEDVDVDFVRSAAANGSTNYRYPLKVSAEKNADDAFESAKYVNKNTKKYIVKGDVFFDQNDKNNTIPMIYVKNPRTGNVIAIGSQEFNTFASSELSISKMNDIVIDNYLKKNNLNADF